MQVYPGEGPSVGQVWEKNQIIGLKEDKDTEEWIYINDLTISLLSSSSLGRCPHPFYLDVHLCLASVSSKQIQFFGQGTIPGQEIKISIHASTHCCSDKCIFH